MDEENGVKGGQGRYARELNDAATWLVTMAILALVIILVLGRISHGS